MKLDLPRSKHEITPCSEGERIIRLLTAFYEANPIYGTHIAFFADHVADMRRNAGLSLKGWLRRYDKVIKEPESDAIPFLTMTALLACAFSVAAALEDAKKPPNRAWEFIVQATFYFGIFGGHMDQRTATAFAQAAVASRAAATRHAENRAIKAEVFAWCDENFDTFSGSMDDAALAIAEKLVPIKFRAVRAHMTEWKKLRSAGTM